MPQFADAGATFARTFARLSVIHIAMALALHGFYALSVGHVAEAMARPAIQRGLNLAMGAALLGLTLQIVVGGR